MLLPSSIYERIPQFWMLIGLMFFAFGLYLGFDYQLIFVYLALGFLCVGHSLWIFQERRSSRSNAGDAEVTQQPAEAEKAMAETEEQESAEHTEGVPSY